MSQTNGSVFQISQEHTFEFRGGKRFSALITDLKFLLDEARDTFVATTEGQEDTQRNFLERVQNLLKETFCFEDGSPVVVSLGEADVFADRVTIEYSKKKESLHEEWRSIRKSPTSMEPSPAD